MITLSEILALNPNSNLCKVRIPIFEPAGNSVKVELWATMLLPPGIHGGYEVGDVVFVSFADNSLSRPVVLGQLYRGPSSSNNRIDGLGSYSDKIDKATDFTCVNLIAEGEVTIPTGTKLTYAAGPQPYATIQSLIDTIQELETKVAALEETVANLSTQGEDISDLKSRVKALENQGLLDMIF